MDAVLEPFPADRLFPSSSFLDLGDLNESDFLNNAVRTGVPSTIAQLSTPLRGAPGTQKDRSIGARTGLGGSVRVPAGGTRAQSSEIWRLSPLTLSCAPEPGLGTQSLRQGALLGGSVSAQLPQPGGEPGTCARGTPVLLSHTHTARVFQPNPNHPAILRTDGAPRASALSCAPFWDRCRGDGSPLGGAQGSVASTRHPKILGVRASLGF